MTRKSRRSKTELQDTDAENGVEKSKDSKNSSVEEAEDSESNSEVESVPKKRKSDKGKSTTPKKLAKKMQDEVQEIIDEKLVKGVRHYLIRWKGYEPESDTWEPESSLNCPELIKKYKASHDKKDKNNDAPSPVRRGIPPNKNQPKKKTKQSKKTEEPEVNWESDDEFEVANVLDVDIKRNGKREFLVSWKGYPRSQDSWEPEENLDCTNLISKFMSKVNSAKGSKVKELRVDRTAASKGRKSSNRLNKKQRVSYHDSE